MTGTEGVWAPERRRLTVGLALTVTLVAFESLAVSTVMPAVSDDLGGLSLYGWVFSAFFLGTMVGAVVAGRVADERGTALPYMLGLALFAAGITVGGAAPTMGVLVAARLFQGVGAGVIPAVAYISVGRLYPSAIRPRVFAVFSTAWVVPGVVGPAAASAIERALSWRWVFFAILPLVVLAAVMTLPALRLSPPPEGAVPDPGRIGRAVVLAGGAAVVLIGTSMSNPVLAAVLVLVGVPVAGRALVRLVPRGTLRVASGLPAAIALRGVLTFAFFATDAFLPLVITDVRHRSTAIAGLALTTGTVAWTTASWVQQRRVHVDGPRRLLRAGFVCVMVGIGGALLLVEGIPLVAGIALWGVAGFGIGLSYSLLSVTVLARAPAGGEGAATSALQLTDVLGVALGTGAVGALVDLGEHRGWDPASSLRLAFVLTLAVATVGAALAGRVPAHLDEPSSQPVHS